MNQSRNTPLLAEKAFSALRSELIKGTVRSGQMVSIAELCQALDFPIAPIRDAVKRAASAGLVTVYPQRGVVILEATPENLNSTFHFRYVFDQEGARIRAENHNTESLNALRAEHIEVLDRARTDLINRSFQEHVMELDWRLHQFLSGALANPLATKAYAENKDRISILQKSRPPLIERIVPAMTEHVNIIDAIISGSQFKAMEAVQNHYQQTLRWWGIMPTYCKSADTLIST